MPRARASAAVPRLLRLPVARYPESRAQDPVAVAPVGPDSVSTPGLAEVPDTAVSAGTVDMGYDENPKDAAPPAGETAPPQTGETPLDNELPF